MIFEDKSLKPGDLILETYIWKCGFGSEHKNEKIEEAFERVVNK